LRRILELLRGMPGAAELEQAVQEQADSMYFQAGEPADLNAVTAIKAPVFGPSGRVVLCLAIAQFDTAVPVTDIAPYAERLLEGTRRVTAALYGSEPFPHWAKPVEAGGRLRPELQLRAPAGRRSTAAATKRTAAPAKRATPTSTKRNTAPATHTAARKAT